MSCCFTRSSSLSVTRSFFNLCRLKGVSFDLQERTGTVFNLMDSFARGVIGIVTVGKTLLDALRKFADCLEFIQRQVGLATTKSTTKSHEVLFKDVVKAIKHLVDTQAGCSRLFALPMVLAEPAMVASATARRPCPDRTVDHGYLGKGR